MRVPLLPESRTADDPVSDVDAVKMSWAHVPILLGLLLCVIVTYYPVVRATYGFTDDYYDLQDALMGGHNLWRHHVSEGRPIMGIMHVVLFPLAGTVDHLGWLRAINLASLCVLASAIYFALCRLGFACAIAGVAAWLALTLRDDLKPTTRLLRGGLAGVALLVSLTIYQPAGMFFWVVVAMSLLTVRQTVNTAIHKFSSCLAISVGSIIAEFITFKIGTACYGASDEQRAALTRDVLGKAIWFLRRPLRNALNLDVLHPSLDFAIIAAVFIVGGLVLCFAGSWKQRGAMLGIALVLIPLSYLPNLAAADSFGPHRTQVALTPLLAFYFLLARRCRHDLFHSRGTVGQTHRVLLL